ncbi:MAG: hypothetical protein J2O46_06480, partial [Nocardioides sp.]|nr:hypothetical protein [Nocardioides sp.]
MNQRLQSYRTMSLVLLGVPVLIGVVVFFALGGRPGGVLAAPPVWVPIAQVVLGVVEFVLLNSIGYGNMAIEPGADFEESQTKGLQAFQSAMFLRFAVCEFIVFVSLAVAFLVSRGSFLAYAGGAVVALVLLAWFVYPSARNIRRQEAVLDRK